MVKIKTYIDPDDGKEVPVLTPNRKKYPKGTEFIAFFRESPEYICKLKLKPNEISVFFGLLTFLEYENWIRVSQITVAEKIGIGRSQVNQAIKNLIKLDLIRCVPDPIDKRRKAYRLNPLLGWKGSGKKWTECVNQEEQ